MTKKIATAVGAIVALYLLFILVGGLFAGGCVADRVEARLSKALAADVKVSSASVSLATGNAELENISIKRDGVDVTIKRVEASLPGWGAMVFSRDLEKVVVSDVTAALSARGAAALAGRDRKPLHIDELHIKNATVSISPTLIIPGLGKVEAAIESAEARDVNLASVVSWLSDLDEMVASATLPGGAGAGLSYKDGKLGLSGSWFGSNPLEMPFKIPELSPDMLEAEQLKVVGKALLQAATKHLAKDKLFDAAKSLLD